MDYRPVIESKYNRQNWQTLLHDIFGNRIKFWNSPSAVSANSQYAKQALWLGTITLSDEQTISVYEVELSDSVDIERNRRGIRDMLLTTWRSNGNAGAFMFCYRKNESVLRFSYVSEAWTFADDGAYQKESTDAKRFTYLLGEGHRSRTAIQQFEKLKASSQKLKDLTKAFSVDAVSDMFFDEYKKNYEDIIQFITGKRMVKVNNKWEEQVKNDPCEYIMQEFAAFANPEKAVRDYVKKLMGRLVFLQFLQKKGWLGVPANAEWGSGDPEFIQNLFAQTADKDHFIDNVLESLFNDLNSEDERKLPQYRTPYLNGGLFERDASDETNFPLPAKYMQQMLDFFSSYNFTIDENDPDDAEVGVDPEMLGRIFENLLEDNKDKGAFYTPKEIVTYMCRESLIAYLQTDVDDEPTKEAIRQFVTTHNTATLGNIADDIDQRLKDVKICDPAIGSGAFPMGLLKELFLCRTALEGISPQQAAEIKKHIIQQNIYGVDIERGAVDIARLRFWLSLIVDEETPQALPNLDFKIMQGNSLLEQYKGIDLSTMTERKYDKKEGLSWFDNMVDVYREELRNMLAKYYNCTNHNEKNQLRTSIINNVKKQLAEQSINVDFGDLDLSGNNQFMLWHTWFYDVFSKGGFDIVIGNPPYVSSKALPKNDKALYRVLYESAEKQFDLYSIFIEKGISLLRKKGIISYIVPDSIIGRSNFAKIRNILIIDNTISRWIHLNNVFESAVVSSLVFICQKLKTISYAFNYTKADNVNAWGRGELQLLEISSEMVNSDPDKKIIFASSEKLSLQNKLTQSECFENKCIMWRGEEIGKNSEIIRDYKTGNCLPVITGKETHRYGYPIGTRWIIQDNVVKPLKNYKHSKILIRQVGECINATIDNNMGITTQSVYSLYPKDESEQKKIKGLVGVLNSKLFDFFYKLVSGDKQMFKRIILENIKALPYPNMQHSHIIDIERIVDIILMTKKDNPSADTSALESEIDTLVYQLYGLTEEEIKIVEGCE